MWVLGFANFSYVSDSAEIDWYSDLSSYQHGNKQFSPISEQIDFWFHSVDFDRWSLKSQTKFTPENEKNNLYSVAVQRHFTEQLSKNEPGLKLSFFGNIHANTSPTSCKSIAISGEVCGNATFSG